MPQRAPAGQLDEAPRIVRDQRHRPQEVLHHGICSLDQGAEDSLVVTRSGPNRSAVASTSLRMAPGAATAQWMGEGDRGMDPLHLEAQVTKERRGDAQGGGSPNRRHGRTRGG